MASATLPPHGKVGIIGAGVVGLSCALHLQRRSYEVELLDPRLPGEGASLGNGGIIAISEVLPIARPSTLCKVPRMLLDQTGPLVIRLRYLPRIAPWLIQFIAASRPAQVWRLSVALASLLEHSIESWCDVALECAADHFLLRRGWLRIPSRVADMEAARRDAVVQRELGVQVELLGKEGIQQLEPALAPIFDGAVYFPDVMSITSPLAMMQAIAARVVERGGIVSKREIVRIDAVDGRAAVVDASGERSVYDRLVVAAGAWSRPLVRSLGVDVPLDTERGYNAMLPPPAKSLQRPVTFPTSGFSLAPMQEGIRLTTGVELAGLTAPADFRRLRRMITLAQSYLPGLGSQPLSDWLGFRPSMPSLIPVIGSIPKCPQVILAFGHGHLGVTLGPITGDLVASIIAGRTPRVDMSPFLPERALRSLR